MSTPDGITGAIVAATDVAKPIVEKAVEFAENLLGEPLRVAGGMLADQLYAHQTANRIRILERVSSKVAESGVKPDQAATGFLLAALEAGGQADTDELQDKWADLLAKAMSAEETRAPAHIETLRRLGTLDVRALDGISTYFDATCTEWEPTELPSPQTTISMWIDYQFNPESAPDFLADEVQAGWPGILSRLEVAGILRASVIDSAAEIIDGMSRVFDEQARTSRLRGAGWQTVDAPGYRNRLAYQRASHSLSKARHALAELQLSPYGVQFLEALGLVDE